MMLRTLCCAGALAICHGQSVDARSAIYGGGPFYSGGTAVIDDLRASGFSTVMLWSIHVTPNGDLYMNDKKIVANGRYVGISEWQGNLRRLRTAPTSVNRIEVSVGSAGTTDFDSIKALVNGTASGCGSTIACGTGTTSILYRNFQTLKTITGADAANFDDESTYDVASASKFGTMLSGQGYRITFAPYTQMNYWMQLKNNLGNKVDAVYLQAYDGGAYNVPANWSAALGLTVDPGLWSYHGTNCNQGDSPTSVQTKMAAWKRTSPAMSGGFIWLYDDIQKCAYRGNAAAYASAVNNAVR